MTTSLKPLLLFQPRLAPNGSRSRTAAARGGGRFIRSSHSSAFHPIAREERRTSDRRGRVAFGLSFWLALPWAALGIIATLPFMHSAWGTVFSVWSGFLLLWLQGLRKRCRLAASMLMLVAVASAGLVFAPAADGLSWLDSGIFPPLKQWGNLVVVTLPFVLLCLLDGRCMMGRGRSRVSNRLAALRVTLQWAVLPLLVIVTLAIAGRILQA